MIKLLVAASLALFADGFSGRWAPVNAPRPGIGPVFEMNKETLTCDVSGVRLECRLRTLNHMVFEAYDLTASGIPRSVSWRDMRTFWHIKRHGIKFCLVPQDATSLVVVWSFRGKAFQMRLEAL